MTSASSRTPGRPRSESARRAILSVTAHKVATAGYGATTIDAIAAEAGVGKQTIYRWWPTKADLVLDATAVESTLAIPVADRGNYAADLRAFLSAGFAMASREESADLLRALMVEAQLRPDFGQRFVDSFLAPRREAFAQITSRAAARGDLPDELSPEAVADIVFGTLWYRLLTHRPLENHLVEQLVIALVGRDAA